LLAYYIAAVNIEGAFHSAIGGDYLPFDGIVLTDTFQMFEGEGTLDKLMFPENNERVNRQKQNDIRVIIGNPPYSAGQDSENDGNKNLKYPELDNRISKTYVKNSNATLTKNLYDSYIRAIRWASDRIKDKGIVCYISNGSFIDSNNMDGLRKCLINEFTSIYCFNLRGNARTSGEQRRKEKGNVFGEGTRTPVAITMLIKNPDKTGECNLFYHDIGDYLSQEEKLQIIIKLGSIKEVEWENIVQNDSCDWINQRNIEFDLFVPLGEKLSKKTIFYVYSAGILTSRDKWVYNFSRTKLSNNMNKMIDFYNSQTKGFKLLSNEKDKRPEVEKFIDNNPQKISWSRSLKKDINKLILHEFQIDSTVKGMYRPFCRQWVYFDSSFNEEVYKNPKIFPNENLKNLVISTTGIGASKDFSALMTDAVPNYHLHDTGQCFPLYTYEKPEKTDQISILLTNEDYVKQENISDEILSDFKNLQRSGDN